MQQNSAPNGPSASSLRPLRSWLFAPGDSEKKLGKLAACGADVAIADLEDAVAPDAKDQARAQAAQWLTAHRPQGETAPKFQRWVRINALGSPFWEADLAAIMKGAPDGVLLPKARGPQDLDSLHRALNHWEKAEGLVPGSTAILPLVSETAKAALTISAYALEGHAPHPRLKGLTWGAEDLSVALGASRKRDAQGRWTDSFRHVRSQVLLTARAAQALPIDTLYADFRDEAGLAAHAAEAFADGFAGMLAIHPAQVPIINAAFTPGAAERAEAEAIIAAFAAAPGAGAVQLGGRMLDLPHLAAAKALLANKAQA